MLREVGVFTAGVQSTAVGTFLIVATLGAFGYVFCIAYTEMDWRVVAQENNNAARTSTRKTVKKGDVIIRMASGELKVLHPDEFGLQFEVDPGGNASADGFQPYRATGKLWAHELSNEEAATHFPVDRFISQGALVTVKSGDILVMPFPGGGAVYRLDKQAFEQKYATAISDGEQRGSFVEGHIPSQAQTLAHWEKKIKTSGAIYRKTASMHAKLADEHGTIQTIVDGVVLQQNLYNKGDYVMIGSRGARYSMPAADFSARYDRSNAQPASDPMLAGEGFSLYPPTGTVWARNVGELEVQHFFPIGKFSGKWGGAISMKANDYLAMPHPACREVYVIQNHLFHKSYARNAPRHHIPSETETLALWESVLSQDTRVCRRNVAVLAKVADGDGILEEIMEQQQHEEEEERIDVEIPQQENEAGVAVVELRSGGDANAHRNDRDSSATLSGNLTTSSLYAGWLTCAEPPVADDTDGAMSEAPGANRKAAPE